MPLLGKLLVLLLAHNHINDSHGEEQNSNGLELVSFYEPRDILFDDWLSDHSFKLGQVSGLNRGG